MSSSIDKKSVKKIGIKSTIEEHLPIILPLVVTYGFGFLFACFSYTNIVSVNGTGNTNDFFTLVKVLSESIIPSTITFALVNTIQNLVGMIKNRTDHYLWNVLTLIFVSFYELLYYMYDTNWHSIKLLVVVIVSTIITIIFTVLAYFEVYNSTHRNHNLV